MAQGMMRKRGRRLEAMCLKRTHSETSGLKCDRYNTEDFSLLEDYVQKALQSPCPPVSNIHIFLEEQVAIRSRDAEARGNVTDWMRLRQDFAVVRV